MIETIEAANSGYRFMPGVSQYSCGIGALPGFTIERVRFAGVVPLKQGFAKIAEIITTAGRPLTAFGACELRSPAPFTEDGFRAFNEIYIKTLIEWGVMKDGINPVARSNVCPKLDPPSEPGFYAFSFATAAPNAAPSFVVSAAARRSRARPIIAITRFASATPARKPCWRRPNSCWTRWSGA
jgi:hypothetical protein